MKAKKVDMSWYNFMLSVLGVLDLSFNMKVTDFDASIYHFYVKLIFLFVLILLDGNRVIVAVGNRVLLYDGNNGDLIESLRGTS